METVPQPVSGECELPLRMASLQIDQNSVSEPSVSFSNLTEPKDSTERVLRSTGRAISTNRRVTSQPKKWISAESLSQPNPDQYYLVTNKLKASHSNLETIFEEPQEKLNKLILLGTRKMKRSLNFLSPTSKKDRIKSKKRHAKIKKFFAGKSKVKKVSDEQFGNKMKILNETLD